MRLAIGLPLTTDREYTAFWDSFVVMRKPSFDYYRPMYPGPMHKVRNELVRLALDNNNSHLLMLDTDQVLGADTIELLASTMARTQCAAVGAIVYRRYPPYDPLVFFNDGTGLHKPVLEELYAKEDLKVDAVGCGAVLYDMNIFRETIESPWFEDRSDENNGKGPGEDIGFCFKLAEAGLELYINSKVQIDHLGLLSINRGMFMISQKLQSLKEAGG